jgi:hypothetical protein
MHSHKWGLQQVNSCGLDAPTGFWEIDLYFQIKIIIRM